jgi:hypothetical protein
MASNTASPRKGKGEQNEQVKRENSATLPNKVI